MRNFVSSVILLIGLASAANSATVDCDFSLGECNPTGIKGLAVDNKIYDLHFLYADFNTAFPSSQEYTDAFSIVEAAVTALESVDAGPIYPTGTPKYFEFLIPVETGFNDGTLAFVWEGRYNTNSDEWYVDTVRKTILLSQLSTNFVWAVPELVATQPPPCNDRETPPLGDGIPPKCTPPGNGPPAVPLPASLPLLIGGIAGLGWLSRRRKA